MTPGERQTTVEQQRDRIRTALTDGRSMTWVVAEGPVELGALALRALPVEGSPSGAHRGRPARGLPRSGPRGPKVGRELLRAVPATGILHQVEFNAVANAVHSEVRVKGQHPATTGDLGGGHE